MKSKTSLIISIYGCNITKLITGSKYCVISVAIFTCVMDYIYIYKLLHAHINVWSRNMDMDQDKDQQTNNSC
jgi:UDP-glucose 4-epimerase